MNRKPKIHNWIKAFRLHTLPLASAAIITGNVMAWNKGGFKLSIFIFSLLTAILLQILSNLANDYGDTKHGADSEKRLGPERMVQSGMISKASMRRMILVFMGLSLISGVFLLWFSLPVIGLKPVVVLLLIGLFAIWSAFSYTASDSPYGYKGYGDFFVFLFFGLVAVYGSYFLQTASFSIPELLPSIGIGLLSSSVLNLNNIRDFDNDKDSGKITLAVRLGLRNAKIYHAVIICIAVLLMAIYFVGLMKTTYHLAFLIPAILFLVHIIKVYRARSSSNYYRYLKELSIFILLLSISFSAGLLY